jgi:hypothetical protein
LNKLTTSTLVIVGAIIGGIIGQKAMEGVFLKQTDYTEVLMQVANKINANLPMTINSDTQLVSTVGFNDSFTYKYKLIGYDLLAMDVEQFKQAMSPKLKNSVCTSETMSEFRKLKIVVIYSYMDMNHMEIAEFPVDTKDC